MRRPLLYPVIAFISGIALTRLFRTPAFQVDPLIYAAAASVLIFLAAKARRGRYFYVAICSSFLFLGVFRFAGSAVLFDTDISRVASAGPVQAVVEGTVRGIPRLRRSEKYVLTSFVVRARRTLSDGAQRKVTGNVLVQAYDIGRDVLPGDRVVLNGVLSIPRESANPAGFDRREYLFTRGITAVIEPDGFQGVNVTGRSGGVFISFLRGLTKTRYRADLILRERFSSRAYPLARAVLLGMRGGMSPGTERFFERTGTMHILAISGLHTGIAGGIMLWLLLALRLPRKFAYIAAIAGVCAFALFSGARPSSVRAAIMLSFVFAGALFRRKPDVLNSLALSAFLITFFYPAQLFAPGFILSYTAVLSILVIGPYAGAFTGLGGYSLKVSRPRRMLWYVGSAFAVSLAVTAGMAPVIGHYFNIFTPSAILANLIAIPLLFVLVISGYLVLLLSLVPFAGFAVTGGVSVFGAATSFLTWFLRGLGRIPGAFVRVTDPSAWAVLACYMLIALVLYRFRRAEKRGTVFVIIALLVANLFIWTEISRKPPLNTRVTVFDAGKADASLVEFPDRKTLLIDTGTSGLKRGRDIGRDVIAPYLWSRGIRKVDCLLITHSHEDHAGGAIYLTDNFNTGTVITNGRDLSGGPERDVYSRVLSNLEKHNIRTLEVSAGDALTGLPAEILIFNPLEQHSYGDANNDSVVCKMTPPDAPSFIFCADAGSRAMVGMLRFGDLLDSDIIKVPHHGGSVGKMAVARLFFKRVNPDMAVITNSSARKVRKDVLDALEQSGVEDIRITGESGAVIIGPAGETRL
ncbi:MAG: DNA internalization-related competence protein ComEC/Rec2 [Candidatus Omnitrophica bacterium]|nr:DNA internalization-related competence protein ComEC/Rec2 [Candidatus Omnitrophota bacterium]